MGSETVSGVQIKDMRAIPPTPWRHWSRFAPNSHEFVDPAGDRVVRAVLFERLEPGDATMMAASHLPTHINSYDVLIASLRLPLPGSGLDPIEPIGGALMMRPECLLAAGGGPLALIPGPTDHLQVNLYIHTDGPSGEPMITLDQLAETTAKLEREHPGSVHADRGEFVTADGEVHELLEICWEDRMGRKFPFPDPPRLSVPLLLPITAYPWQPVEPGVQIKPFLTIAPVGPELKLVKLDKGAGFPSPESEKAQFVAVMAGAVRAVATRVSDISGIFAPAGESLGTLVAEEPSLLWLIQWDRKPRD